MERNRTEFDVSQNQILDSLPSSTIGLINAIGLIVNFYFSFSLNLENNLLYLRDFYEKCYFTRTLLVKLDLVFHHFLMSLNKQNTGIMFLQNIGILILMICLTTNWSLNIFISFLRLILQGKEHNHFKIYFSLKIFF